MLQGLSNPFGEESKMQASHSPNRLQVPLLGLGMDRRPQQCGESPRGSEFFTLRSPGQDCRPPLPHFYFQLSITPWPAMLQK